jgi:GABA(A) receptor-associated protein
MNLLTSSVAFRPEKESAARFVEKYTFDQRTNQSSKIRDKYPDHVPVILEPALEKRITKRGQSFAKQVVDGGLKTKYLVPGTQSVAKFMATVRKQVKLSKEEALYLMTLDNTIPASVMTMAQLDKSHRSEDGFLYLVFTGENTFGAKISKNK